jgi:cytochrome c oxidase cbb3-type subunit III
MPEFQRPFSMTPNRKVLGIAAVIALGATLLAVRTPSQQPDAKQAAAAAAARGKSFFGQSCGFCHGPDATGARGPDLVRSAMLAHDVNGNLIGEVIKNGRPDKGMPPIPATDDQIADVAAFLHARAKEALESSGVPSAYPVEKLLTGNLEKGRAFFEGAGGCKSCHSPTGDLAGVAKKYSTIELESHMLYPDFKPPTANVTLANGETISGVVSHIDDFSVSIRVGDKSGWNRSFARDSVKVELNDPATAHRELLPKLTQDDMHNLFAYINSLK